MKNPHSPEQISNTADRLGVVALFAGMLAVGVTLFKQIFTVNNKNKGN